MFYLQSLRPINLIIIAITQWLVYYMVIRTNLYSGGTTPALSDFLFSLLVLDTLFIAASANVINDIFDEKSDAMNGKLKQGYVRAKALVWFLILAFNAILLSVYIAWRIDAIGLSLLSIGAIAILVMYSAYFQKIALVGNFVVSIFVAFVIGIVWFAEREAYDALASSNEVLFRFLTILLSAYMIFSFVINMFREIVKDIQDHEGDLKANYQTISVTWGRERAKIVAVFYGAFLLILELVWMFFNPAQTPNILSWIFFIIVILPTILNIYLTIKAKSSDDYKRVSTLIKWTMAMGLIYLVLINIY